MKILLICAQWSVVNERVNIIHLRRVASSENTKKKRGMLPASMEEWIGQRVRLHGPTKEIETLESKQLL